MFYGPEHLQQLRLDAKLNAIDTSRAKIIQGSGDSFIVELPRPLWDITAVLDCKVPPSVECISAHQAEGELLTWLLRLTRAERLQCRRGRVYGWSADQLARRPLSDAEVTEYKAVLKYRDDVASMQAQLSEALVAQQKRTAAEAGIANLTERYGLTEKPKPTVPNAHKTDPAAPIYSGRQVPSTRKGAKR